MAVFSSTMKGQKMKKFLFYGGLVIFLGVVLSFFPCVPAEAQDTVRIGALFPFSGAVARMGEDGFRGADVARILRNEQGGLFGKKIEFVKGDAVDPKAGQTEAERLITVEKVKLIIGTQSSAACFPASAVAEKAGVIYWELASSAEKITDRGYKYLFRTVPHTGDPGYVDVAVRFFVDYGAKLGIKANDLRLAIAAENSIYGSSIAESSKKSAQKFGVKVVALEVYDKSIQDLSSLLLKLKATKPDAIIAVCYPSDAILFTRQSKELDFSVKMFSGLGHGHNMQDFADALGEDSNGITVSGWPSINTNAAYAKGLPDFLKAHRRLFKEEPQSAHVFGNYNGAWILFNDVLPRAGSLDPEAVRKAAKATNIPWGGTPIGWGAKFGEDGQIQGGQLFMNQWQDRKLITVWPEKAVPEGIKVIFPIPAWADRGKKK
jgi:branched-chain amino acid transport system substrate-binding protein